MEGTVAATPREEMTAQEVMMPAGTQGLDPGRKVSGQRKTGEINFTGGPTVTTRSMKKQRSLIPCQSIESLPSISGVLVRAIASCESDNGFSFAELKEVLSTKGYNVSRHCPNIKRKLNSLVSKGALVRMTRSNGSTFFVVRKYQEMSTNEFGNSEEAVGTKKAGKEKRNTTNAAVNTKGAAKQPRRSAWDRNRKLQPGEQQQRRSTSKTHPAKRSQSLLKKATSAAKKSMSSGSNATSTAKRPHHSNGRGASTSKKPRSTQSRSAPSSKKGERPVGNITSQRLRSSVNHVPASAKGQGSPYGKDKLSGKKTGNRRRENAPPARGQKKTRGEGAFPQQRPNSGATSNIKRPSRR